MKQFFVEGLVIGQAANRRSKRSAEVQPFSRSYWANNAEEALRLAREDMPGAQWIEGPRLARQSEEQRMRQAGAPELFSMPSPKKTTQRRTKR
jgi:hypothetical protein